MSYELRKPITDKERADFIIEHNHGAGLHIEDTDMFLFALEKNEIMGTKEIDGVVVPYPVIDPDYEEKQAALRRQMLDRLSLTPSDVERALYKAKGMDFEDLKALIASQAPFLDMKALAIEFRANNFYRGAEINGMRLIDTVGALLGYTTDEMDNLFLTKELPTVEPTEEPTVEPTEEPTEPTEEPTEPTIEPTEEPTEPTEPIEE